MAKTIRVVVTCTDRKKMAAPADLQLRNYRGTVDSRTQDWIGRINKVKGPVLPAYEMYQGEHWSVVRELVPLAEKNGIKLDLWVASAGYGLIPVDEPIESYSATFSMGSKDSISRSKTNMNISSEIEIWWKSLSRMTSKRRAISSLAELACYAPSTPLIVSLSQSYMRAMHNDFESALSEMNDKRELLLVSAGSKSKKFENVILPLDARLQKQVGGTLGALNVRAVKKIIETSGRHNWEFDRIRKQFATTLNRLPEIDRTPGRLMTDHEILRFIQASLRKTPGISRSTLLRQLRDSGMSCEQKRFSSLCKVIEKRNE